ncbi:hypothetical protein KOM00_12570 [Geomonas sp. Red69]|uniref:Uncharacterized protein n=1 Tax=Geomonas diazotrophica TaxID=2843197 RepID=A0ABX8JLY7_9BACT|nr:MULTISPECIES: hypothetical protein [Geomonas]MBU5637562.1 hypothetical protein [Geomonas diazotrophica]QWV99318.1 hypothetical protein KP005_08600 [Geomonas nitrogeniifigens]QXE88485.1 hypothetical protein KP003_08850 [Geomonas nitrogeniifigens]
MEYSGFMLALGGVLPCLGLGLFCYLLRLLLEFKEDSCSGQDPQYVRDINRKLNLNNVETERDIL